MDTIINFTTRFFKVCIFLAAFILSSGFEKAVALSVAYFIVIVVFQKLKDNAYERAE